MNETISYRLSDALTIEITPVKHEGHVHISILEANLHGIEEVSHLYLTHAELIQLGEALVKISDQLSGE